MADTLASLRAVIEDKEAEIAQLKAAQTAQIYEGGYGNIVLRTVARDEGEAINNFMDKEPILAAIGCTAQLMPNIDGCRIVAIIPDDFVFGDDKRNNGNILD